LEENEEDYETAYVVLGEDGQYEFVDPTDVTTVTQDMVRGKEIDENATTVYVQSVKEEENEDDNIEYIYAEQVNEKNEIIIGEVPKFDCDLCGKSFKRFDSLTKHQSLHTGRTQCPVCDAVFSRVAHRTRHMKIKHPDYPLLYQKRTKSYKAT